MVFNAEWMFVCLKFPLVKSAFVLVLALSSASVRAVQISGAVIKTVHVNVDSGIYFRTEDAVIDPEGCGSNSWYRIKGESVYEKEAYALLLAASMSKSSVTFYFSGCENGYPKVTYINASP